MTDVFHLEHVREEILATTKLPLALQFLEGEMKLTGRMAAGVARLSHYFTPFQCFIIDRSESEASRFDLRIGLRILEREARYRAESPSPAALFVYQFECLTRNRLGYDDGLKAIANDPFYNKDWQAWILRVRKQLGIVDFADMLYLRSQHWVDQTRKRTRNPDFMPSYPMLFDIQEGRIAKANVGKDPLYMFGALQRQLGYPEVPKPNPQASGPVVAPVLESRFQKLEARVTLLEQELKGGIDLPKLYQSGAAVELPEP